MKRLALLLSLLMLTAAIACAGAEPTAVPAINGTLTETAPTPTATPAATMAPANAIPQTPAPQASANASPAPQPTLSATPPPAETQDPSAPSPTMPLELPTEPTPANSQGTDDKTSESPTPQNTAPEQPKDPSDICWKLLQTNENLPSRYNACDFAEITDNLQFQFGYIDIDGDGEFTQVNPDPSKPEYLFYPKNLLIGDLHREHKIGNPSPKGETRENPYIPSFPSLEKAIQGQDDVYVIPLQEPTPSCKDVESQNYVETFLSNSYYEAFNLVNEQEGCKPFPTKFRKEEPARDAIASAIGDWMNDHRNQSLVAWTDLEVNSEQKEHPFELTRALQPIYEEVNESKSLAEYIKTAFWASKEAGNKISRESWDYNYRTPLVSWELVHDHLPIVQVTAWSRTNLPYKKADCNNDLQTQCGLTDYAVTFVVAFQECGPDDLQPYNLLGDILIRVYESKVITEVDNNQEYAIPFEKGPFEPQDCQ